MTDKTSHEFGVLHARVEVLQFIAQLLLARLSEDDLVGVGSEVLLHVVRQQEVALNSTFPDSYSAELGDFLPALLAAADAKRLAYLDTERGR